MKTKTAVAIALVIFILIIGNIITFGLLPKIKIDTVPNPGNNPTVVTSEPVVNNNGPATTTTTQNNLPSSAQPLAVPTAPSRIITRRTRAS